MTQTTETRRSNRLINETSPYLLQHAYNPVDWYPWGPEALERAKQLDRPILLSVGYSSCHWCHVMERESFENDEIARLMNEHFVCIKVDREERPDLDEIYMQATVAMNQGHGGWPMTVFLTPEQQPFFAGTYFPPTDRWGRPGFGTLLKKIAEFWVKDRQGLREQAGHMTGRLKQEVQLSAPASIGDAEFDAAVRQYEEEFDARYGGFGGAPKFPPATGLSFLLRQFHRTGSRKILDMVCRTLDGMAAGGIYDHVGGGFARYSTDAQWLVPHFEKMLYDNALLAKVYVEAYQTSQEGRYRRVATETLEYILREMTGPEGAYYSATDADSEGVEGKFFVWTPEEIRHAIGDDREAARFCAYYDISETGNWVEPAGHGESQGIRNIPHTPRPIEEVARECGITVRELEASLDRTRRLVYEARQKRVPPCLDDKIIVAWNGLMISAMAEGARVFGEARYLSAAVKASDFLLRTMVKPDGRLFRTYRLGRPQHEACLEDYACLAEGLIDFYEAGAPESYLTAAVRLAERIVEDFRDEERGGFYTTGRQHEALLWRGREGPDGATPSANAVAASVLTRLSFHYSRDDWRELATNAIRVYGRSIARYPRAFAKSLIVAEFLLEGPVELALVGHTGEARFEALRAAMNRPYLPHRIIAHGDPSRGPFKHPLLSGKSMIDQQAALYICRNFACQAPLTDPASVESALSGGSASPVGRQSSRSLSGSRQVGHATPGGTAGYAARMLGTDPSLSGSAYTSFGSTGLTTSRLGFGCYRVDTSDPEFGSALALALRKGCNLIDTSTNYADGDSERLVGLTLAELQRKGEINRDEIIVVTKIGYVQDHNLKQAEERERMGRPYPEMVKYGDGIWHCLHPEFLADQLASSLDRLGLATVDVCLLHNPEYFLLDAQHQGRPLDETRREFDRRLDEAFRYLEEQVRQGRIRYYGVSSNTVIAPAESPETTSLSRMLEIAETAAREAGQASAHFQVLQCPLNLFESGAVLLPNTGLNNGQTVLDYATAKGIAVLANRPLNAMPARPESKGGIVRLAEVSVETESIDFPAQRDRVAALEATYQRELAPHVPHAEQGLDPKEYFTWSQELAKIRPHLDGLEHWEQVEHQMVAPHLNQVVRALNQVLTGELAEQWEGWRDRYLPELLRLLKSLKSEAAERSRLRVERINNAMTSFLSPSMAQVPLSQKALLVVMSTPGVTSVLNGMRTEAYVEDSFGALRRTLISDVRPIYEAARRIQWS
ncbi:MAG TPA: aldo/keto reductase [Nitrospiraceae bacterium]|nr:aldo/keto reductase [Nitrospiraceae bacterium]